MASSALLASSALPAAASLERPVVVAPAIIEFDFGSTWKLFACFK